MNTILTAYERDSITRVHKNKEDYAKICPLNQRLFTDFLLFISINNYTYKSCMALKSSVYSFLIWNLENNGNTPFTSIKKIHFSRYFTYCSNDLGYSYDRVRIIKSHLCTLSDFAEHILGCQEFMPNSRGDKNRWYKFKNIVKDVEHGAEQTKLEPCNKHTFSKDDLDRLEWFLDATNNYEGIVVLHFCALGIDLLDLKRSTVETYNHRLCNKWLKFLDRYNIPFDNAFIIQCDRQVWRVATKEDIEKYEEMFTAFLGRKFVIC